MQIFHTRKSFYTFNHSSSGLAINLALFIAISSVRHVEARYTPFSFSMTNAKSAEALDVKHSGNNNCKRPS